MLGLLPEQTREQVLLSSAHPEETIVVERSLHETYGKQWKLTAKAMRTTPLSPANVPV